MYNTKKLYGFYSPEAAVLHGTFWYCRKDGSEVEVTAVCSTQLNNYRWKDKVYLGEVAHFIRPGNPGMYERYD